MTVHRKYLGAERQPMGQRYSFLVPEAVEVDTHSYTEIERTRVYFDDVVAVTHHRYRGVGFLILTALAAMGLGGASWWAGQTEVTLGVVLFCFFGLPFVLAFTLRAVLGVDIVGVYGRRTFTRMRFGFRKGHARRVYESLVREITAHQERSRAGSPPVPPA